MNPDCCEDCEFVRFDELHEMYYCGVWMEPLDMLEAFGRIERDGDYILNCRKKKIFKIKVGVGET